MTRVSFFSREYFFVNFNYLCVYLTFHLHNYIAILLVLTVVCCLAEFYLVRGGSIVKCPAVFVLCVSACWASWGREFVLGHSFRWWPFSG